MREFHISRQARTHYQFEDDLFSYDGSVILANFHAVRQFVQKINQKRDLVNYPERAIKAGQVNAMGLMDEIFHFVVDLYQEQFQPDLFREALNVLESELGIKEVELCLAHFCEEFPPSTIFRNERSVEDYLNDQTENRPNKEIVLEELMLLWITNKNPALLPYGELFDDDNLAKNTIYIPIIQRLQAFFSSKPPFGPDAMHLIAMLRSPAVAVPYSLEGQLEYIRSRWGLLLGKYLYQLLSSLDLMKEEQKVVFDGPGPLVIPVYDRFLEGEFEQYSPDRAWMPRLVLMAKNTYVWLDQLSKKYQRSITKLNEIPEEELIRLAEWGFSGLWLIGLWERSQASARIKQLCGNPEAISSAYSLREYRIAADLGGEESYQNLKQRAWSHGIRLASDMVPNHMAIDSTWVIEHPDWFISSDFSPFPSYSFSGPDLSPVQDIGIFIEDHYYTRNDAAVVFKRVDRNAGKELFIYHGNDGTNMPWNDTAQLNYLNPTVREEVIRTIVNVARMFPIIRFDAAMTLTKRHFHRLWFPEPGSGGDIPSRAGAGLTKDQFNQLFPAEFWREVVDRVAIEAPDTLLLAEAFWLMEGYFVRTLGMHRVYNSAFMNMLRNEENVKYRTLIKNTLEFDPEILKRYVNFMNNPDEKTAVEQFGTGDKYFGILTLMVTLPGLPMFGHGQIEGFAEKYGMEYRRAYWDEPVNQDLVTRHQRQIFPLLHQREKFSGVENFLLYDYFTPQGIVNEDVFAYSNGTGAGSFTLVIYHNRFAHTQGWIKTSAAFLEKTQDGSDRRLQQKNLSTAMQLHPQDGYFVIYRDIVSGLEFIQSSKQIAENGFFIELGAYECHVFVDMREVEDDAWQTLAHIHSYLQGKGVPDIQEAIKALTIQPVQNPFKLIANPAYFQFLLTTSLEKVQVPVSREVVNEAVTKLNHFLDGIEYVRGEIVNREEILSRFRKQFCLILQIEELPESIGYPGRDRLLQAWNSLLEEYQQDTKTVMMALLGWLFLQPLNDLNGSKENKSGVAWFEEWQLDKLLHQAYFEVTKDDKKATYLLKTVRILMLQYGWYASLKKSTILQILETWLSNQEVQAYLGFNRYKEILWFNKEAFETFVWWMRVLDLMDVCSEKSAAITEIVERIMECHEIADVILIAKERSDYQVARLFDVLKG